MKLCKNCKQINRYGVHESNIEMCCHPNLTCIDYVFGGITACFKKCQDCRNDDNLCSKEGKWFEQDTEENRKQINDEQTKKE